MSSSKLKFLPNLLTFCNMSIGIIVIGLLMHDKSIEYIRTACLLVYVAVLLDMLDGPLARRLKVTSDMGKQLDSFADFVTFGIAPIMIFLAYIPSVSWYYVVLMAYPLAGAFRLARFNLKDYSLYFVGLPITASGFIMVTVLLNHSYLSNEFSFEFEVAYLILALILSCLMVSNFRVKRIMKN